MCPLGLYARARPQSGRSRQWSAVTAWRVRKDGMGEVLVNIAERAALSAVWTVWCGERDPCLPRAIRLRPILNDVKPQSDMNPPNQRRPVVSGPVEVRDWNHP